MRDFIHGILKQTLAHPARSAFLILAVAMGSLSFAVGAALSGRLSALRAEFSGENTRYAVGGGSVDSSGSFEWKRPPQFNQAALERIRQDMSEISALSPISEPRFMMVTANKARYTIRSVLGVGLEYEAILGLSLVEGRFFSQAEEDTASRVILLSETTASVIYGGVKDAIGAKLEVGGGAGSRARMETVIYEVIGVYEDPSEFMRKGFGAPDALIPYTAAQGSGMMARFGVESFIIRTKGIGPEALRIKLLNVLSSLGVTDPQLELWEGNPLSALDKTVESTKQSMFVFSSALISLSFIILALSAVGVFSSVNTEVADAGKSICVRRALGADRWTIARGYLMKGLGFGLSGGILGILAAYPAYSLVAAAVGLALERLGLSGLELGSIPPLYLLLALAASALMSLLFSLMPALRASRLVIVEGLKDL